MAFSQDLKTRLLVALAEPAAATELEAAVEEADKQAAAVADISLAVVTGVDGTGNNAASKADVDARLSTIQTKINDILTKLEDAGLMAT